MKTLTKLVRRGPIVAVAIVVLTLAPAAAVAAQQSDPFVGSYRSIDTDGSNQLLAIGGPDAGKLSGVRAVVYLDDVATVCGGSRSIAKGFGVIDGTTMYAHLEVYCGNAGNLLGEDVIAFTADPASETLTDSYGVVWSRP